jgi:signal peptidase
MTGSMEPAIHTGSIVSVKQTNDYKVNEIITVKMKNDPNQTYTHRIIEITNEGYITKGDANESEDPDIATNDLIVGEVLFTMPLVGYLTHFAKQPTGFILLIIVPCIIIIALEINNIKEFVQERTKEKEISEVKNKKDEKGKTKNKKKKKSKLKRTKKDEK